MRSNFKFLLVLTILLLGCVCVGSTFATDVSVSNVDDTINLESLDDSSQNDVEINNLQAGEGNFTELQKAVDDATGTLRLDKDYKYVSEDNMEEGVLINKSLIIDGKGHTLDANNLARIFLVNASDVTLKNINFINAYSMYDGGAIYFGCDNAIITGCSFINNNVSRYGGALTVGGLNNIISDCSFVNNNARMYGAIYFNEDANGSVDNCNFVNNYAYRYGGAIGGFNGISVIDCIFKDNYARAEGGAIYLDTNCTIRGCNFTNCSVFYLDEDEGLAYGYGGAISVHKNNSICDCIFVNNYALIMGGAISSGEGLVISGCSFVNDTTSSISEIFGLFPHGKNLSGYINTHYFSSLNLKGNIIATINDIDYKGYINNYGKFVIYGTDSLDLGDYENILIKYYSKIYGYRISTVDFTIVKVDPSIMLTVKSNNMDVNKFVEGDDVIVTVTLPKDATGKVLFSADSVNSVEVPIVNGIAKYIFKGLKAGDHTIDAEYSGDNHYESIEASDIITITKKVIPSINVMVKSSNGDVNKFVEGDDVIVTVTLPKDATGFVLISVDGGKWIKAPIVKGVAEYTFKGLKAGNHTFLVKYPGDDNYLPVATTVDITITKKTDPNPTNHSGIPMEHTGNPLIALLFALIILPILRRK